MANADKITEAELRELYEAHTLKQIAKHFGCGITTIFKAMMRYGIPRRSNSDAHRLSQGKDIDVSEARLRTMYEEHGMTLEEIAKSLGCSKRVISRNMKDYGIPMRDRTGHGGGTPLKYPRQCFSGDEIEKAYLISFAAGDLHVNTEGRAVVIRSSTTRPEQIALIQNLFESYGHVAVTKGSETSRSGSKERFFVRCYLDKSFAFLLNLDETIPDWILKRDKFFDSFLPGYTDAEGSFGVYQGYGKFKIESSDRMILVQIKEHLATVGIQCSGPYLVKEAGERRKDVAPYNLDFWSIRFARKADLLQLIQRLSPYLKHASRKHDMERVRANIERRNK